MNIVHQVEGAIAVLKLDKAKMAEIARNKEATVFGIVFLAAPVVVNIILLALAFPSEFGSIFSRYLLWPIVIPVLAFAANAFLMSLIAEKAFKWNSDHVGFFRIMSYASVVLWVTVIPFVLLVVGLGLDAFSLFSLVSLAAGLYLLYIAYNVLMEHHKLTKENAVYTIIAGFFISIVVNSILGNILVGGGYKMY